MNLPGIPATSCTLAELMLDCFAMALVAVVGTRISERRLASKSRRCGIDSPGNSPDHISFDYAIPVGCNGIGDEAFESGMTRKRRRSPFHRHDNDAQVPIFRVERRLKWGPIWQSWHTRARGSLSPGPFPWCGVRGGAFSCGCGTVSMKGLLHSTLAVSRWGL